MNKDFVSFSITAGYDTVKKQMLNWVSQFNICSFLDNHNYQSPYNSYECIAAVGATAILKPSSGKALTELQQFLQNHTGWVFGHLSYDLKNEIEQLQSLHEDNIQFPEIFFFVPQVIVLLSESEIAISTSSPNSPEKIYQEIISMPLSAKEEKKQAINFQAKFSKPEYCDTIKQIQAHILRGDCYEINFCQEFFSDQKDIDTIKMYESLCALSPNPFAAYYKIDDKYLICSSPERYLKKKDAQIISQPIKGTWKRDIGNADADAMNKKKLYESEKERAENVMVVDLVRNDLSRICMEGTVTVDELFGIYSYPQVHQMVSTISGQLKQGIDFTEIIRATFPMGSMTGAPKRKVMELIEQYERTRRGIFSGAVGYIDPEGNFDFNVVIRSILYNKQKQYLSYLVGSGITFYSNPENEYEECLLKARAIKKVLE